MNISDWRSDTVTQPTAAMKAVMLEAPLGDDVLGEDPSVNALEAKAAALFGMEAALFCPSGTMTNQIAVNLHTHPPCEAIVDQLSHIYNYEVGGAAFNSGASLRLANGRRGMFTAEMARQLINKDDVHLPETTLLAIENTSNRGGGACYDFEELKRLSQLCKEQEIAFHLDLSLIHI